MYGVTHSRSIIFSTAFLSILISFWIWFKTDILNPDAICYLQSAESMKQGIQYAMQICGQAHWPFYTLIISVFHDVTQISYINAAYILDGFFSLLSVMVFVVIIGLLKKPEQSNILLLFGAIVILSSHIFNDTRHYIIRDHGYWAFYLLAFFSLLKFYNTHKYYYAYMWGFCSILATLFRIEGVVFLIFIPFSVWFSAEMVWKERLKIFLQLNTLSILSGILLCVVLFYHPPESLGRLQEINFSHAFSFINTFQQKAALLKQVLMNADATVNPQIILFFTLISWYLYSVINNVSWVFAVLAIFAIKKHLLQKSTIVIWTYLIVNVFITFLFLTDAMFLSKRYLLALSLILMLYVPFALYDLMQRKWIFKCILVVILISTIGSLFNVGHSKRYIRDAGEWLRQNVPAYTTLYSNDRLLMYYSKHFVNQIFEKEREKKKKKNLKQYDYIALRINKHNNNDALKMLEGIHLTPLQVFSNNKGDEVKIFQRR